MLEQAFSLTRNALRQPAIWSVALWSLVFLLLMLLVMTLVMGAGAATAPFLHPFVFHPRPFFPAYPFNPARIATAMLLLLLVIILAGPLWMAGVYGTLAAAVRGDPVGWGSFWSYARSEYGRAWGLIAYTVLFAVVLAIVGGLLALILHVAGVVLMLLLILAVIGLPVRMIGGLFLRHLGWGQAFSATWPLTGYGSLWLGMVGYAVLAFVFMLIVAGLGRLIPLLGPALVLVVEAALQVVSAVWSLALYQATTP